MTATTIEAAQKREDTIAVFWLRKASPHLTRVLLRTPITPNQTTVLWGTLNVLNSWAIYVALTGTYGLIAAVPLVYVLSDLIDCVDGEIARYRGIANPVVGKLLDGVCHRATEYSLLIAFSLAAFAVTRSPLVLPIALLLFSGDAMYTYVYERRLTTLRHDTGFTGHVSRPSSGTYVRGTQWHELSLKQKIGTVTGQLHHKSIYVVFALSLLPGPAFLTGLAALAVYKHWKWMRLLAGTIAGVRARTRAAAMSQAGSVAATADPLIGRPANAR